MSVVSIWAPGATEQDCSSTYSQLLNCSGHQALSSPGTSQRLDSARGRCLGFSFKFKKLTWKVWRGMKSFLLSLRRPRPRLHNFYPFQRVLWTVNSMELAQRKTTKCLNFTFLAVQDIAIGDLEPWTLIKSDIEGLQLTAFAIHAMFITAYMIPLCGTPDQLIFQTMIGIINWIC